MVGDDDDDNDEPRCSLPPPCFVRSGAKTALLDADVKGKDGENFGPSNDGIRGDKDGAAAAVDAGKRVSPLIEDDKTKPVETTTPDSDTFSADDACRLSIALEERERP